MLKLTLVTLSLIHLLNFVGLYKPTYAEKSYSIPVLDSSGYVIYCPCMGRFGNQAEHLLGAIAFSKLTNRTLVLPPFPAQSGHVPFDDWFKVDALERYHRVILAEDFMRTVASHVWPEGKRIGFCYHPSGSKHSGICQMKDGSPFGPFWNFLGVQFDETVYYSIPYNPENAHDWLETFPPQQYPVLAFRGAPASFPVHDDHRFIQGFLWWSEMIQQQAAQLAYSLFGDERYVALHLRNGYDWERACSHAVGTTQFMASPQCFGYHSDTVITEEVCFPSEQEIIQKVVRTVEATRVQYVYVATDKNPLLEPLNNALSRLNATAVHADPDIPQLDLAVMAQADVFIGNCVSSFSAFVKRERDFVTGKPSMFFGID